MCDDQKVYIEAEGGREDLWFAYSVRTNGLNLSEKGSETPEKETRKLAFRALQNGTILSEYEMFRIVAHLAPLVRTYNVKYNKGTTFKERCQKRYADFDNIYKSLFDQEDLDSFFLDDPVRLYNYSYTWLVWFDMHESGAVVTALETGLKQFYKL
jgi:hypothetical protein